MYDSCQTNELHEDFAHDACPTCDYILQKQSEFNEKIQKISDVKELLNTNIESLNSDVFSSADDVISRRQEDFNNAKKEHDDVIDSFNEQKSQYEQMISDLQSAWGTAASVDDLNDVLTDTTEKSENAQSNKVNITNDYNTAKEKHEYTKALENLSQEISEFVPEITILSDTEKTYDKQKVILEASVTVSENDSGYVNPVKFFVLKDNSWVEIGDDDLINAGTYSCKAVTQDPDYQTVEKEFNFTVKPLEIEFLINNKNKTYDGTSGANIQISAKNVIDGDDISLSDFTSLYSQKDVGTDLPITINNLSLNGNDAGNYKLPELNLKGNIIKKDLHVSAIADDTQYGTIPNVSYIWNGFIDGEDFDTIKDNIELNSAVTSTKVGTNDITISVNELNTINYNIISDNGTVLFVGEGESITINIPDSIQSENGFITVIADGKTLVLDKPIEIMHPTDKDIIVTIENKQYLITKDGKVYEIYTSESESVSIDGQQISINGETHSILNDGIILKGNTQDIIIENTDKDIVFDEELIISGNVKVINSSSNIVSAGDMNIGGSFIIESSDGEITINGNMQVGENISISDSDLDIVVKGNANIQGDIILSNSESNIGLKGNTSVGGNINIDHSDFNITNDESMTVSGNINVSGSNGDLNFNGDTNISGNIDVESGNVNISIGDEESVSNIGGTIEINGNGNANVKTNGETTIDGDIVSNTTGKTDLDFNGKTNVKGNVIAEGNINISTGSSESDKTIIDKGIVIKPDGSLTIDGAGEIDVNDGIGGTSDSKSGNININGGNINSDYIGNHPEYVPAEDEQLPQVIIDGGKLNAGTITNPIDKSGQMLRHIQVESVTVVSGDALYTRSDDKNSTLHIAHVDENGKMNLIVNADAKKVWVLINDTYYYVNTETCTLHEDQIQQQQQNSNWSYSSSYEDKYEPIGTVDVDNLDEVLNNSDNIHIIENTGNNDVGGYTSYIASDKLEAKEGYALQEYTQYGIISSAWKNELPLDEGIYDEYKFWIRDGITYKIKLCKIENVTVDCTAPKISVQCSNDNIKIKKVSTSNKYRWYTNKKITFAVSSSDKGSGIKKMQYQIVSNDKKPIKKGWKTIKDGTFSYTPKSGNKVIYIRSIDNAGNIKIVKTVGIKGDSKKPIIKVKGNKVFVSDETSGIKKVTLNGKKTKMKFNLKKGNNKIVAIDKAGNKITRIVKR